MPYKSQIERRRAAAEWRKKNPTYAREYFQKTKAKRIQTPAEKASRVARKQTPRGRLVRLLGKARERANATGIPFSITIDDLVMPETCPILGIPIDLSTKSPWANRPSLDRTDGTRGYVPGNVAVVSMRANTRKGAMSISELRRLLLYMEAAELLS